MKKFLLASLLSASVVSFALAEKIVVAATPIPHAEILEQIGEYKQKDATVRTRGFDGVGR